MKRLDRPADAAQLAPFGATPDAEPAVFRHPRAARELRLGTQLVAFELRRARRRSIGFIIGAEGLSVAAPRWLGQDAIDAAVHEKSGWILRKLGEQHERSRRLQAARVEWRDGTVLPYLGEPLRLRLGAPIIGAELAPAAADDTTVRQLLLLGLPVDATPARIREAVEDWLLRQARRVFEERCAIYAGRIGVRVARIGLSNAQTRWGSASIDGSVRLNWRLIHFALPTIDYVVAHELSHLRHMDHSALFWGVVGSVIPDYKHARRRLREGVLPVFD